MFTKELTRKGCDFYDKVYYARVRNNTTFLAFNYTNDIYIGNLSKKIKLVELGDYINNTV